MVDPPQLPGFYYDPKKRKYFRILEDHAAPPESPYTQGNIRRRAEEAQRKNEAAASLQPRGRIQRSPMLQHPLGGALKLASEMGRFSLRNYQHSLAGAYVSPLKEQVMVNLSREGSIAAFAQDPNSGGLFVGLTRHDMSWINACIPRHGFTPTLKLKSYQWTLKTFKNELTSMTIGRRSLLYTSLGANLPLATTGLSRIEFEKYEGMDGMPLADFVMIRTMSNNDVWSSACAPTTDVFAVGTSGGVAFVDVATFSASWAVQPPLDEDHETLSTSDILAIQFLTDSSYMTGQRSGAATLLDRRADYRDAAPMKIQHPACVTHVRRIDDYRVLINGLCSSICMYDLRYPRPSQPMEAVVERTMPLLRFEQHYNEYRVNLGFDVDLDTGVLAVGREDSTVHLYNVHTAQKLRPPKRMTERVFPQYPRCLKFGATFSRLPSPSSSTVTASTTEDLQNSLVAATAATGPTAHPSSLLIAAGHQIYRWAW